MSKKRDTINPEIETLPQEDVVDEYGRLAESYKTVKTELDANKQKIHQTSQLNSTLQASQGDLQYELEQISKTHQHEMNRIIRETSSTIEHLRQKNIELSTEKIQLEATVDDLNATLLESQEKCEKLKARPPFLKQPRVSDSFAADLELELDNLRLNFKEKEESLMGEIQQKQQMIDELNETAACLEDNLATKQSKLDENNDTIEQLQEKNQELTVEIATLKSAPVEAKGKGNSLFGELDDQRQQLKKILISERAHYKELKKTVNAKEMENRRLKRENINIKTEIQACSALLRRGDEIASHYSLSHANQLQLENVKLASLLAASERNIVDLATKQKLDWVAEQTMSTSKASRDLKDKFLAMSLDNLQLADSLSKSSKDLSKSRLDCVKYKQLLSRVIEANHVKLQREDVFVVGLGEEVYESLVIEEYEKFEESEEESTSSQGAELGESTIMLIGGRERLGSYVSATIKTEKDDDVGEVSTKATTIDGMAAMAELKVERVSPAKGKENRAMSSSENVKTDPEKPLEESQPTKATPSKQLQTPNRDNREKSVKFSSAVKTKFIDDTQEQYEQSQQARKRSKLTVKHIHIKSKAPSKSSELN